jgi:hypothetical protein
MFIHIYVSGKQKSPDIVPLHKICWHQDNLILDENPSRCPSIEQWNCIIHSNKKSTSVIHAMQIKELFLGQNIAADLFFLTSCGLQWKRGGVNISVSINGHGKIPQTTGAGQGKYI